MLKRRSRWRRYPSSSLLPHYCVVYTAAILLNVSLCGLYPPWVCIIFCYAASLSTCIWCSIAVGGIPRRPTVIQSSLVIICPAWWEEHHSRIVSVLDGL